MTSIFKLLRVLFAVCGIFFTAYFIASICTGMKNIGSIAGLCLSIWITIVSIKPLNKLIKSICMKTTFTNVMFKLVNILFITFAIYGIVVTVAMIYCAYQAPAANSTAVVLGAQVKSWGPSTMLRGRIDAAYDYLEKNPDTYAILTGGQGDDEPMSEAQSMFDTLKDKGVDSKRMYMELMATNTTENIQFSSQMIRNYNLNEDMAIVTDGFHQLRARIITKQLGITGKVGAVNANTSLRYLPVFAIREWFALPYQLLFR
jgi:uncharacterized SAM-binding protein YcdF (DUF218 family)